ncbi:hypothetical protein D0864_13618 [Hortaea werneckii]|uniref:Uncharacterized protein n=1 Tax=Hortaea werneckii TaxID=91943 RepID=A0A3M7CY14_HORWE|nr:hypothetical protein D0864_13618 [Hortaea werneckii]
MFFSESAMFSSGIYQATASATMTEPISHGIAGRAAAAFRASGVNTVYTTGQVVPTSTAAATTMIVNELQCTTGEHCRLKFDRDNYQDAPSDILTVTSFLPATINASCPAAPLNFSTSQPTVTASLASLSYPAVQNLTSIDVAIPTVTTTATIISTQLGNTTYHNLTLAADTHTLPAETLTAFETSREYTTVFLNSTETLTSTETTIPPASNYTTTLIYFEASGAEFCSSFMSYAAPTNTRTTTLTPEMATQTAETTQFVTSGVATVTGNTIRWKRDIASTTATYQTVDYVPPYSAVILATTQLPITARSNGTEPLAVRLRMQKRQDPYVVPTPTSIVGWPKCLISQACAQVATGVSSAQQTTTFPAETSTLVQTATSVVASSSCVVPAQDPAYTSFTPIWGEWSGDTLGDNRETHYQEEAIIQLPFPVCLGGYCSPVITVGTDGYIVYNDATTNSLVVLNAFTWQGSGLYIYPGANGVFYRIAGPVGARSLVFSWYAGTYEQGAEQNHFTITLFENAQVAQLKYYDVVQAQPQAFAYIQLGSLFP